MSIASAPASSSSACALPCAAACTQQGDPNRARQANQAGETGRKVRQESMQAVVSPASGEQGPVRHVLGIVAGRYRYRLRSNSPHHCGVVEEGEQVAIVLQGRQDIAGREAGGQIGWAGQCAQRHEPVPRAAQLTAVLARLHLIHCSALTQSMMSTRVVSGTSTASCGASASPGGGGSTVWRGEPGAAPAVPAALACAGICQADMAAVGCGWVQVWGSRHKRAPSRLWDTALRTHQQSCRSLGCFWCKPQYLWQRRGCSEEGAW